MKHIIKDDIEREDELDDFSDSTVDSSWYDKQKELVTNTVDYNLGTLANLIDSKIINLSPQYQRRFRWDTVRQSRLIESFLLNVPVPPVYLNEDKVGEYSVIDGKQRLTAISEFFKGNLKLSGLGWFSDLNGKYFSDLPKHLQAVLKTRINIRAIIILNQSDKQIKYEVFYRLNTGGVTLNAQEIRNSAYPGALNDLIQELSTGDLFHNLLGIKVKNKSMIYMHMRDAEFILRYFTFRVTWPKFPGQMRDCMDFYMENHQRASKKDLEDLKTDFLKALNNVAICFGPNSFRRWLPDEKKWRNQVLASVYDAQMFALREFNKDTLSANSKKIENEFKKLFSNMTFRSFIDVSTNRPSSFTGRIEAVKNMVEEIVK